MNLVTNPSMGVADRLRTTPVDHSRTMRPDIIRTVTSGKAGIAIPLGFIPLNREDALETTRASVRAYMDETQELLINTVHCTFTAWAVPKLAFDRFGNSPDALNRAYLGQEEMDGSKIPWILRTNFSSDGTDENIFPFYKTSGAHADNASGMVNADYNEAYLKVFEYRCRQRSEALWEAVKDDYALGDLLPAFFDNPQMSIVKSSFDDAMMDGTVPLEFIGETGKLNVARESSPPGSTTEVNLWSQNIANERGDSLMSAGTQNPGAQLYAELRDQDVQVSVANIDLARETSAWARVRSRYQGLDDDQLIDLLMAGVRIPQQYESQPYLLDRVRVPFGMTQRYSTEAENLEVSATKGQAGGILTMRTPRMNYGGVIVIMCEVVPEQFWERSKDYWLHQTETTRRPDRLIDQLDPQAVEIVNSDHADVRHSEDTIWGYAPLNHEHVRRRFNMGGKFYKPDPNAAWTEDRNRIWASEPIDPKLSKEMFLATDLPDEIFRTQTSEDNFEFSAGADAGISGLTYLGPLLREQTGQYDAIMDRVDTTRISGTPVDQLGQQAMEEAEAKDRKEAEEKAAKEAAKAELEKEAKEKADKEAAAKAAKAKEEGGND